jgi:DNA topoisomerase-1
MEKNTDLEIISHLKPSKIVKIMKDPKLLQRRYILFILPMQKQPESRVKKGKKYSYYKDGEKIRIRMK